MSTLIIGASGRARHGKTDFCKAIAGRVNGYTWDGQPYPGPARLYDIGDLIRRYCITQGILPQVERADMNREQLEILINVGKEKRAVDVNFWIGQMIGQIALDNPSVALLPNIRYENEARAVKQVGGYVVRLTRLNENGSVYISEDRPANDISETALEFWPADFYLTVKNGHAGLLTDQAITLYGYLEEYERIKRSKA